MSTGAQTSRLAVLVFTDVVGSSELKRRLGVLTYAKLLARHDAIFRELLAEFPSAEVLQDTGDGFFAAFATVGDAVRFALRFQDAMHREPWGTAEPFQTRVGIHLGELAHVAGLAGGPQKVVGIAADLTHRVMSLACGGQILLTRAAFDEARQFVSEYPSVNGDPPRALRWMAHGDYIFHGAAEPVQVFEVGGDGIAPLSPPRDREKARRSRSDDNKDEILGWRPAIGLAVPQAPAWVLEKKLGEGTFGEVWLAHHATLRQKRVFKFCFDAQRLESFKRELTLFRLLRDALGDRPDIARLHDVCFDRPPFFLETEYAPAGNLIDWAAAQGGLDRVPLETRLEIVAQVCDAVAAAHSVGVLHKDIKPSNILMHAGKNGAPPRPQLADFGIGLLTDKGQLAARHITEAGFTMMNAVTDTGRSGTRIYMPPEAIVGRPFTMQGDIYALGVLLYQVTVADLDRPMALGWERGVHDDLLCEDIAACVDGDPERRVNSATEIATRLRRLPERRVSRAHDAQQREAARRRQRLLRVTAAATVALCVIGALAVIGFFRERRLRVDAQMSDANSAVSEGFGLHLAGRGQKSREAFVRAREAFQRLGVSTLPADVGLYRSFASLEAPINTIPARGDGLMAVAWSNDGRSVAAAGQNGSVRLWDARTGREVRSFEGHKEIVNALAFSPDGKRLISGGKDQFLRVWDVETGKQLHAMLDPSKNVEIRGLAFAPDGRHAVSGTYGIDPHVRLWDVDSGKLLRTFDAPREPEPDYYGVAFSPDGQRVAAATYGGDGWVWRLGNGNRAPVCLRGHTGYVISVAFSPDGRSIVTGSLDNTLRLWDAETGARKQAFHGHLDGVRGSTFIGGDSDRFLSCSMDRTLRLWNTRSDEALRRFAGHTDGVRGLATSKDGTRAASGGMDDTIRIWNLGPGNDAASVDDGAAVTSLSASTDGMLLVSGNVAGIVTLRDLRTLRTIRCFTGHERPIDVATLLGDGQQLFTADSAGRAIVFEVATGTALRTSPLHATPSTRPAGIRSESWCYTAVSADGRIAVSSGGNENTDIIVWSPQSNQTIRTIKTDGNTITSLAITRDGARALAGHMKTGEMSYWELGSGALIFRTPPPEKSGSIDTIDFSPDGKSALIGGHDSFVHLWDLEQRREVRVYRGHTHIVRSAGFGYGGAAVFSAGSDKTIRLFNAETASEFELGVQFPLPVYAMAVIPPGDAVAAASGSTISVLDLARAGRYVEQQPKVDAAIQSLQKDANDGAALLTLGRWYAFRGIDDWAATTLDDARYAGADVPALLLAQSYWRMNRTADAAREFRRAIGRNEAPVSYLELCIAAAENPPATRPSTQSTRGDVAADSHR